MLTILVAELFTRKILRGIMSKENPPENQVDNK